MRKLAGMLMVFALVATGAPALVGVAAAAVPSHGVTCQLDGQVATEPPVGSTATEVSFAIDASLHDCTGANPIGGGTFHATGSATASCFAATGAGEATIGWTPGGRTWFGFALSAPGNFTIQLDSTGPTHGRFSGGSAHANLATTFDLVRCETEGVTTFEVSGPIVVATA